MKTKLACIILSLPLLGTTCGGWTCVPTYALNKPEDPCLDARIEERQMLIDRNFDLLERLGRDSDE